MRTNPHRCRRRTRRRRAGAIVMQLMEIVLAHSLSRHNDTVIPLPRWREGRPQQRAGSLHDPAGSQESRAGICEGKRSAQRSRGVPLPSLLAKDSGPFPGVRWNFWHDQNVSLFTSLCLSSAKKNHKRRVRSLQED
ncbi:hypothetical protein F2Q69_00035572 [Brassica cretica]|uniref:Uncharacterized protein n=1 Tax=Brassica cretica TaxID=69181 RepID=A0A8S9SEB9_BRACR|nr:hypothetical protein F2Q69_00035572 [Brassica cretica]